VPADNGDALRHSPQAAHHDAADSSATCQRSDDGGNLWKQLCPKPKLAHDPNGRVNPACQKLLRNAGPLSHSPQATPPQDMTLRTDGSLNTQAEGSLSVVSLREHRRMSEQGARATKETDIDASRLSSLVDPPRLPVTGETVAGIARGSKVPPQPSSVTMVGLQPTF